MKLQNLIHTLTILIISVGFLSNAQAVSPPPDGGYPRGNTAEGQAALLSLTTGGYNTAVGFFSLRTDMTGSFNTGIGAGTLLANTGDQNTATGAAALLSNAGGSYNTAHGSLALFSNTSGMFNSALGQGALSSNTMGDDNTACGAGALFNNTIGAGNTASGFQALNFNSGSGNTAIGYQALEHNTTGANNIALGTLAGSVVTAGDDNIDIGNFGFAGDSGTIRIGDNVLHGATYIAGISGVTVGNGMAVIIDTNGHLGTIVSSRRFKKGIKPMDDASERLFLLKPVVFRYNEEIDPAGISQFGLVAEDVEKVSPDLVVRDKEGKPYTVRYEQVNAMLLNEFLKEHQRVRDLEATVAHQRRDFETTISQLEKEIATIVTRSKEQDAKIQTVRAQVELTKEASRTVANDY